MVWAWWPSLWRLKYWCKRWGGLAYCVTIYSILPIPASLPPYYPPSPSWALGSIDCWLGWGVGVSQLVTWRSKNGVIARAWVLWQWEYDDIKSTMTARV
jgi:hypothetical protein